MCEGRALFAVDHDGVEGACGGREVLPVGLLTRPRLDCGRSCERVTASPPELLSSSSSDEDSMDNNVDHAGHVLMNTSLPLKRVGIGEGESEMEGEREMRGGMEEERPGPSSGAVTKLSSPEPDSEAGRHWGRGQLLEAGEGEGRWAAKWRGHMQGR